MPAGEEQNHNHALTELIEDLDPRMRIEVTIAAAWDIGYWTGAAGISQTDRYDYKERSTDLLMEALDRVGGAHT